MKHKGTVLESSDNWALLLMPGGEFKKVKTKGRLHIGEMYYPVVTAAYRPLAAAAVLVMALAFSVNFFTVAAYARFSQGVELGVNSWGRVISIKALGAEGEHLTAGIPIWGKNVEEVLPVLLERTMQQLGNVQEESVVIKVEIRGKYWPRGQSGLEHINKSLNNFNQNNSQGHLMNKEDQSWLWQKSYDNDSEKGVGDEHANSSGKNKNDDQNKRINDQESGNQADKEPAKVDNNRNSDNNKQGNNNDTKNSNGNNNADNSNSGEATNKGNSDINGGNGIGNDNANANGNGNVNTNGNSSSNGDNDDNDNGKSNSNSDNKGNSNDNGNGSSKKTDEQQQSGKDHLKKQD
ncbi:MAG: hypothetical protein ABFD08_09785 [Syntrophomonas sp.]